MVFGTYVFADDLKGSLRPRSSEHFTISGNCRASPAPTSIRDDRVGNRSILFDLPAFRGRRVLLISAAAGAADGLDVMLPYPHEDITLCVNLAVPLQERGLSPPPNARATLH